ncbi:MAG: MATE family efflux transporter [Holosporales bacterium]|jgi:MATE family multidrug resistance protein|nr:MATE family efflux transporter [Holosporales bacterium]
MKCEKIDSSLSSILRISVPLVLSALSVNMMYVIDKVMLAGYSVDAMNACSISGNLVGVFTYMFIGIAGAAEVFVGQFNGSKQYEKLASPAWQMIYMSLIAALLLLPVAYFSEYVNTLPKYYLKEGVIYQKILLYCCFPPCLTSALSAFFVGQGKTRMVTLSSVFAMLLNAALDYIFIYKLQMGCKGAAIATVVSEVLQTSILLALFFSKNNRNNYNTFRNRKFDKWLFLKCIKIGTPVSIGNFTALLAWYVIYSILSHVSKDAATVYGFGVNVYVLFIFIGDGLYKAIATISSNMIGRKDLSSIKKTYRTFVIISVAFGLIMAIPLIIFPEMVLRLFDLMKENISNLYDEIKRTFYLITVNTTVETLLSVTWGVLLAGGDTKYATILSQSLLWGIVVIPTAVLYYLRIIDSVI